MQAVQAPEPTGLPEHVPSQFYQAGGAGCRLQLNFNRNIGQVIVFPVSCDGDDILRRR